MAQKSSTPGGAVGAELRSAWNELIAQLEAGRDAIDDPKLYPPPPTERNRGAWDEDVPAQNIATEVSKNARKSLQGLGRRLARELRAKSGSSAGIRAL
jgi:hypothetical protein